MWRDIKKVIHQHQHFLITTHLNPDGDGIGAACALIELLVLMNKKVRFVCDSPIPTKFAFLDYHNTHERYHTDGDYNEVEVVIVIDTHKKERIGRVATLVERPHVISICIDHHIPSETFTTYLAIDPNACSAGAMVYTLYKECGYELDYNSASGIYTSVICDTGRFTYSSTGRKAHKIADECIKYGVDPDSMCSRLFQHVSLTQIKMFAIALQHMETYFDNKVVLQQIRIEDCAGLGDEVIDLEHVDLDYIHEFNKSIKDVMCVVLLREINPEQVRVSLRSKADLDISGVARHLGGGGHRNAAGVSWKGSMKDVKRSILKGLSKLIKAKVA